MDRVKSPELRYPSSSYADDTSERKFTMNPKLPDLAGSDCSIQTYL